MAGAEAFWALFHRSRSPMLVLDDAGVYTDVNDALCRAIGRTREQVVGQRVGSLSTAEQQPTIQRLWAQLLDERRLITGWDAPGLDGATVGVEVIATADVPERGLHFAVLLPPWRPRTDSHLSPRELEVTALLARGLSGEQIAEQLYLSPETVRTHIRNAMERMHAHTRAQLVALALDNELISLHARGLHPAA